MNRLLVMVLAGAACTAPATSSTPAPVSPTPNAAIGTAASTATSAPRPSPTIARMPQDVLLVLSDVPAGFKLTVDKENTLDDLVAATNATDKVAERQKWVDRGFIAGWLREFTKDALFGAVFIRSSASRYTAAEGAKQGIATNVQATTQTSGGVQVSLGETIGDESYGIQLDSTSGTTQATTWVVYFRVANVSNTIGVAGVKGTVDVATAIDLAKKQLAKLKA